MKLARVKRSRRAAVILAAVALAEGIHHIEERISRRFIEAIEHIEPLSDDVQFETLTQVNDLRDTQIK